MSDYERTLLAQHHLERGDVAHQEGRTGDAIEEYRHSIAFHPVAETYTKLADVLAELGRHEEAIGHCQTAISLDPDCATPYSAIGRFLIQLERWEEAQPWLELALSTPRSETRHVAHFYLGRIHEHYGRNEEALSSYAAAIDANPTNKDAEWARLALLAKMN